MDSPPKTKEDMIAVLDRTHQGAVDPISMPIRKQGLEIVPAHEIPDGKNVDTQDLQHIRQTYQALFKTLSGHQNALGLSAVQIGIPERICLINTPVTFLCLVNAEYQGLGDTFDSDEGCLSLPDETWTVKRYETIWLKKGYVFDLTNNVLLRIEKYFQTDSIKFVDQLAVVIQHEIDHGFGKLISDFPNKRVE